MPITQIWLDIAPRCKSLAVAVQTTQSTGIGGIISIDDFWGYSGRTSVRPELLQATCSIEILSFSLETFRLFPYLSFLGSCDSKAAVLQQYLGDRPPANGIRYPISIPMIAILFKEELLHGRPSSHLLIHMAIAPTGDFSSKLFDQRMSGRLKIPPLLYIKVHDGIILTETLYSPVGHYTSPFLLASKSKFNKGLVPSDICDRS